MKTTILYLFLFSIFLSVCQPSEKTSEDYDLIIYGATPAGITAAVQASGMDKTSLIIVPGNRLGGATSGGLGWADIGVKETIGGLSLQFFQKVFQYYQSDSAWKFEERENYKARGNHAIAPNGPMWSFEPGVAKLIFEKMIEEAANIDVAYNERLDLQEGVTMENGSIKSIKMVSGRVFTGKYFVDASYEGDMMALAGVNYHVGRESKATYKESLAGVLGPTINVRQPKQFFGPEISPYDESGNLLPGIQDIPMGEPGQGDHKIQAYNFRACLTTAEENKIPISRPENYDSTKYELLYRYVKAKELNSISRILTISPMPNKKTDINDGGHGSPFSTDYNGMNWDFPEGDYETREKIWNEHYDFTIGLFYFLGHDPRLPESIRNEMLQYGLPGDEYTDHNHWTPQMYIRETRRMIGKNILTQQDCQENTNKEESIGLASYGPDSHHVQRIIYDNGEVVNEGNFLEPHNPYEIPLGVILPKREECENLIVPVCLSASHVAFGSIRMEPVFMILGQSAATVAALAIDQSINIHDLKYEDIREQLIKDGQKLKRNEINL